MNQHEEFVGEVVRVLPGGYEVTPRAEEGDEPCGFVDRARHPAGHWELRPPSAGDLLGVVVLDAAGTPPRLSALPEDVAAARRRRTGEQAWRGDERTFAFRLRCAGRGLACDVAARLDATGAEGRIVVHRGVRLTPPPGLYWNDLAWLAFGLSLHGPHLAAAYPAGCHLRVTGLDCPLADYRPEAAALAIDGWVRRELGAPDVGASAECPGPASGFAFSWGGAVPFADPLHGQGRRVRRS